MASLNSLLQFNFPGSETKMGSALDPNGDLKQSLARVPSPYKKWQYDAVANNDVTGYFQNPLLTVCNELWGLCNTIILDSNITSTNVMANVVTSAREISGYTYTTGDIENPPIVEHKVPGNIQYFISHTNNVSGVTASTSQDYPDFNSGLGIGEYVLQLTNRYDGTDNASPALGAMTSLFIGEDLQDFVNSIKTDITTMIQSITVTVETVGEDFITTYSSNLSENEIAAIEQRIQNCNSLIYDRYQHDWSFFRNSMELIERFNQISRFNNLSKISLHLIENYVGTDKLKNKL